MWRVFHGLTQNINTYHPLKMVFHEWKAIYDDVTKPNITLKERLKYIFAPPGWSHDGSKKTSIELRKEMGLE